jgi:hypothetical protein
VQNKPQTIYAKVEGGMEIKSREQVLPPRQP